MGFDRIAEAGAFSTVTADFDFRITSPDAAADGFGLLFLPTSICGTAGATFRSNP